MRHTISILLQNEAGALARVAGLFAARGYNIESLHVAPTQNVEVSRLTLVTTGSDDVIHQICNQLLKLVDVVNLVDLTGGDYLEREMMLLKAEVDDAQIEAFKGVINRAGARTLDFRPECYTVELTAFGPKLDRFVEDAGQVTRILTVVRSGAMGISHGPDSLEDGDPALTADTGA